jgi:hypothetical protein
MAARAGGAGGPLAWRGLEPLPPEPALDALEELLRRGAGGAAVLAADWGTFRGQFPAGAEPSWLGELAAGSGPRPGPWAAVPAGELVRRLRAAPAGERHGLLLEQLRGLAGRALGLGPGQGVDAQRPLRELGFDSLMAVELRNGLNRGLGRSFPATLLFDHPTLETLAGFLVTELFPPDGEAAGAPQPGAGAAAGPSPVLSKPVAWMNEEELNALLPQHGSDAVPAEENR